MRKAVLAVDTSGSYCSVALAISDISLNETLLELHSKGDGDHFEQLPSLVSEICKLAGMTIDSFRSIAVGTGPGSFTGIRIGMSFAKGLACGLKIPLVGIPSFLGCAGSTPTEFERIIVVSDARRNEVFAGEYRREVGVTAKDSILEICAPRIVAASEISQLMARDRLIAVTPLRDFEIEGVVLHRAATTAVGLLLSLDRNSDLLSSCFSTASLDTVVPSYVREVSAKTIEERKAVGKLES